VASIINTIVTKSTTQGFPQTGQQIDELSKKQTRLANQSTNTGREFASQASGLGGLVAAYAGAAATTFALQQSFSALSAAARSQALVEGVGSLAQSLGQDGPKIISSIKSITRNQLSLTESAQNAGIALSAGLGGEQIEQLSDIATRASKALGRDLTDSLQRLVRGVGKLEPELLDELGIFTRIEPAVERYATKVGKAASTLTNFERRQAFANAVIEEGTNKYRNVDTSISDSSQNLNRLAANLQDLAIKLGQVLTTILNPIIEFFNKDVTNLAGLAAIIGSLIFSKLGQVTKEGVASYTKSIQGAAATTTNWLTRATGEFKGFTKSITEAQVAADKLSSKSLAGPRDIQKQTRETLGLLAQGPAPADLPRIRQALDAQIAEQERLQAGRRAKIAQLQTAIQTIQPAAGGVLTPQQTALIADRQQKIQETNEKIAKTNIITAQLTETNSKLGQSYSGLSGAAQKTGGAINAIATGFQFLGRIAGGTLTLLGRFVTVFAILDIAGTLFSAITGFANPFSAAIEYVAEKIQKFIESLNLGRKTNDAFASSFLTQGDAIRASATNIENYNKALSEANRLTTKITSTGVQQNTPRFQEIETAYQRRLSEINQQTSSSRRQSNPRPEAEINAERQRAIAAAAANKKLEIDLLTTEVMRNQIVAQYASQRTAFEKLAIQEQDKDKIEQYRLTIKILEDQEIQYLKYFDSIVGAYGYANQTILNNNKKLAEEFQKRLSIGPTEAVDQVVRGLTRVDEQSKVTIKQIGASGVVLTTTLQKVEKDGFTVFETAAINSNLAIGRLNKDMMSGTVSADTISAGIANLQRELKALTRELEINPFNDSQLADIQNAIDRFTVLRDRLASLEVVAKDLKDAFTGSIQAAGTLARTGTVSNTGQIALTGDQQKTNQLQFLSNIVNSTKTIKELENDRQRNLSEIVVLERAQDEASRRGLNITAEQYKQLEDARASYAILNKEIENANNQQKALTGEAVAFTRQMEDLRVTTERRTQELRNQLEIQIQQNTVARVQADNALENLKGQISATKQRLNVELTAARGEAGVKRLEKEKTLLEIEVAKIERAKQLLEVRQQLRDVEAESLKIFIAGRAQQQLLPVEAKLGLGEAFAGLTNPQAQEQLQFQKQIIELESALSQTVVDYDNAAQKNLEAAQKEVDSAAKKVQVAQKEEEIVKRRGQIEAARIQAEYELQRTENINRVSSLTREDTLAEAQQTLAITQIQSQAAIQKLELDLVEERARQIKAQADIFDRHSKAIADVFAKDQAIRTVQVQDPNLRLGTADFNTEVEKVASEFSKSLRSGIAVGTNYQSDLGAQRDIIRSTTNAQLQGIRESTAAGITQRATERQGLYEQAGLQSQIRDARLGGLAEETAAATARAKDATQAALDEKVLAENRLNIRNQELKNERDRLLQQKERQEAELRLLKQIAALKSDNLFVALADSIDIFRNKTTDFITTMLTDVINGTKTAKQVFRDFMFSLATEIQKAIIKKTVAEPISNALAGGLSSGLMGATGMTGAGVSGFFSSIGNLFSGLNATPTGVGIVAPGVIGTGSAIGGPVKHMAAGGYAGLRDRVPALLEPGEFVIRRPAAMAIGGQTLNQMNATGQTAPGNVMVNVNNQGTSQEVVGTPKVSVNGRDMIVDIVVRDIQNNGPIRKTLRGM